MINNKQQDLSTIQRLLTPRTHCAIVSDSAELLRGYHSINCVGQWEGTTELSQIIYGVTREAACELAARCGQEFIIHKAHNEQMFKLVHTTTGEIAETYNSVRLADDSDENYTTFDGIKFVLEGGS